MTWKDLEDVYEHLKSIGEYGVRHPQLPPRRWDVDLYR